MNVRLPTARYAAVEFPGQGHNLSLKQQAEARYRALMGAASSGVYTCDAVGVITYYNKRAADLWGRQPALGDTDRRFCGAHMSYRMDGSFMAHEHSPMADVLAGKASGIYDAEVQVARPDGSRVVVIVNIAPLIDDDGKIVGAVNSFYAKPTRERVNGANGLD